MNHVDFVKCVLGLDNIHASGPNGSDVRRGIPRGVPSDKGVRIGDKTSDRRRPSALHLVGNVSIRIAGR